VTTDIAILGGGLAGSAAAILLSRAGRHVTLVERDAQPHHKVCGEFLSQEALTYLNHLGLDAAELSLLGAVPLRFVRLAHGTRYAEAALPFAARSLTRRTLDARLLDLAEVSGASVLRGCRALALDPTPAGWTVTIAPKNGTSQGLTAKTALLATGKHDLNRRPRPSGKQPNLVAFKMYFRLTPQQTAALESCVELILFRGGYAGLQPVEDGVANLCCLVDRTALQRMGGRWPDLLRHMQQECALLRERLHNATPLLEKPLAIASIPYGYVRPAATDGLWSLGDQAAVIPSFTGDGMSIALHGGSLAAAMLLRGQAAAAFQRQLHDELSTQVALATTLSRGLLWTPTRSLFTAAVSLWPTLITTAARSTRIAPTALENYLEYPIHPNRESSPAHR
jgi:flavin-dependent dehydrogenase